MTEEILMSIKRIIFDLDNTLIDWKEEYWNTVKETFMELHLQCNDETVNRVKCAVDMYEDGIRMTYNKQLMQEAIEKELGFCSSTIVKCCLHPEKYKSFKGFKWSRELKQ